MAWGTFIGKAVDTFSGGSMGSTLGSLYDLWDLSNTQSAAAAQNKLAQAAYQDFLDVNSQGLRDDMAFKNQMRQRLIDQINNLNRDYRTAFSQMNPAVYSARDVNNMARDLENTYVGDVERLFDRANSTSYANLTKSPGFEEGTMGADRRRELTNNFAPQMAKARHQAKIDASNYFSTRAKGINDANTSVLSNYKDVLATPITLDNALLSGAADTTKTYSGSLAGATRDMGLINASNLSSSGSTLQSSQSDVLKALQDYVDKNKTTNKTQAWV